MTTVLTTKVKYGSSVAESLMWWYLKEFTLTLLKWKLLSHCLSKMVCTFDVTYQSNNQICMNMKLMRGLEIDFLQISNNASCLYPTYTRPSTQLRCIWQHFFAILRMRPAYSVSNQSALWDIHTCLFNLAMGWDSYRCHKSTTLSLILWDYLSCMFVESTVLIILQIDTTWQYEQVTAEEALCSSNL